MHLQAMPVQRMYRLLTPELTHIHPNLHSYTRTDTYTPELAQIQACTCVHVHAYIHISQMHTYTLGIDICIRTLDAHTDTDTDTDTDTHTHITCIWSPARGGLDFKP